MQAASAWLADMQSPIDWRLAQHEDLSAAQERLEDLEREYELLATELSSMRASHRTAVEQQKSEEEALRRNTISGEDWYWWNRANRSNRR